MPRRTAAFAALALLALLAAPAAIPAGAADPPKAKPPAEPAVAATVNGEPVPLAQVDAVVRRLPTGRSPLTPAQVRRLRQEVLADLVDDVLLKQFLKKNAPAVDPAETDKYFKGLAEGLRRQGKTPAEFFRETGQTEAQARETWETMLRFNKFVDGRATDAELRKYYAANRDLFDNAQAQVSHVVLRVAANAPPGERVAAREKLAAVRADVAAGRLSFADAARKFSACPTAPAGGYLGYIGRKDGNVDEPVARAAFALPLGAVSDPVDTEFGVHLVLVTARKDGAAPPFEKVVELVRDAYTEDLRQRVVADLRKSADVKATLP